MTVELVNTDSLSLVPGNSDTNGDLLLAGGDLGGVSVGVDPGQASIETGSGNDFFYLEGTNLYGLNSNEGDDEFVLDQDSQHAEISVDAGDGFDLMRLIGQAIRHQFEFSGGKFHMQ